MPWWHMGGEEYSSIHSLSWQQMKMTGYLHALADLQPVPIAQKVR
jgi:hypothetical protein